MPTPIEWYEKAKEVLARENTRPTKPVLHGRAHEHSSGEEGLHECCVDKIPLPKTR